MSEQKHTEGPWETQPTAGAACHGQAAIYGPNGADVAIVYDGERNARLIASAPDLLAERDRLREALERIDGLHAMCGTKRAHKIAREALAGEAVPS